MKERNLVIEQPFHNLEMRKKKKRNFISRKIDLFLLLEVKICFDQDEIDRILTVDSLLLGSVADSSIVNEPLCTIVADDVGSLCRRRWMSAVR
jgi:hypothetical protein